MPDGPTIALAPASSKDRALLERLMQLFLHDLSAWLPPGEMPLDAEGRFSWGLDPEVWWSEEGRWPYLIRVDGGVAGFVLLSDVLRLRDGPGRSVDAFFVLAAWRRSGLGMAIWSELDRLWRGYWEFAELAANEPGVTFARHGALVHGAFGRGEVEMIEDGQRIVVQWIHNAPP